MQRPLFWRQGMLLKPHHFQHFEQVLNDERWKIWQRGQVYPWGVIEATVDTAMLASGVAGFSTLEVILPDGTWIKQGVNGITLPTPFSAENLFLRSSYMIYVGVRRLIPDAVNVSVQGVVRDDQIDTRFVADPNGEDVNNLYEKDSAANLGTMNYVMRVFTNENVAEISDYVIIPVTSLRRTETKEVVVNKDYVPPSLRVESLPMVRRDTLQHLHQYQACYQST